MPVYAYRCDNCGVQFERMQKFSDDPIRVCPECEEEAVKRIIQPAGIIFKGSGWYITDSRSSKKSVTGSGTKKESKDTSDTKASTDSSASSAKESGSTKSTSDSDS